MLPYTLELRRATPEDRPWLLARYLDHRMPEFAILPLPEEQRRMIVEHQFLLQYQSYSMEFPNDNYDLILIDGKPEGKVWISWLPKQARIVDIYLTPQGRNKGAGTEVVKRVMAEAAPKGLPVRMSISITNPGSQRWARRMGFEVIKEESMDLEMEWRG